MDPTCPECEEPVDVSQMLQHEAFPCPSCGTRLELVQKEPARLEREPPIEEDWGE